MNRLFSAAILAAVFAAPMAMAKETVVWWDFLGGGDGVRMKQMIADFNAALKINSKEISAWTNRGIV